MEVMRVETTFSAGGYPAGYYVLESSIRSGTLESPNLEGKSLDVSFNNGSSDSLVFSADADLNGYVGDKPGLVRRFNKIIHNETESKEITLVCDESIRPLSCSIRPATELEVEAYTR